MVLGVDWAFLTMDCSAGSLPVICTIRSALDMMTQSSNFWWRHHWAAAVGSPYMVPEAASAVPARPSAREPATAARVTVLANAEICVIFVICVICVIFTGRVLFSVRGCGVVVEKRFRQ